MVNLNRLNKKDYNTQHLLFLFLQLSKDQIMIKRIVRKVN